MSLSTGQKLGPYEILSPTGAGGMGEVYKAKDTRLDRTVAIKVLPTHIAGNSDLRQRFDREAKAISSLNHPNICTLHDVGHQDGIDYLVMEYLEGETMSERIKRSPLTNEELFRWAVQIGDALSVAHQRGLIHRDLKPGNVIITKEGAKLLDFGLAKLQASGGVADGLTQTTPLTGTGTIVGTLHYMSPEQLEGGEADARSDIFAFGAMLYEMITGQRAFEGKSQASLIAAILEREPRSITELKPATPPALDRVLKKCLAKDPTMRWQSARDLVDELRWIGEGGSKGTAAPVIVRKSRVPEWSGWAIAAVAFATALFAYFAAPDKNTTAVLRAIVTPPEGTTFLFEGDNAGPPVVSPDGSRVAFVAVSPGGAKIWMRELSSLASHGLAGTEGASFPFWSPDSKSLGFFTGFRLMRVDISTEQVFSVCQSEGGGRGGAWGQGDMIVFSSGFQSELFGVPAAGGTPVAVTHRDTLQHSTHRWPFFLPDGKHFLYFAGNHLYSDSVQNSIWFSSLDETDNHLVMPNLSDGAYADGRLFFVRDSVLFVQEFDAATGRFLGEPIATKDRAQVDRTTWKANFSVCENNILVYQVVGGKQGAQLLLLDRGGNVLQTVGAQGNHYNLDLSFNGRDIVYSSQEQPFGDLYHFDLDRNLRTRLTFESFDKDNPVISPSGEVIAFSVRPGTINSVSYEIRTLSISGVGKERLVAKDSAFDMWPMDWSPDGRYLMCGKGEQNTDDASAIILIPMVAGAREIRFLEGPSVAASAHFSPDSRWIAYASPIGGVVQVFVIPSPTVVRSSGTGKGAEGNDSPGRWQISTSGGDHPHWRGDGRELYYVRNDGTAMAVDVSSDKDGFHVGHETELFRIAMRLVVECWDVSPDGQQFVVNSLAGNYSVPLVVVQNWTEEMKK